MNPDLAMGDELLKKTGAGNLFMVFGEPDIEIDATTDGQVVVEIKGVDVYDPTTGEIRSGSTDDIACWFIDTDYNGESFFVRHAYFTGADDPYDKLKRALRAEIDEAAWAASTARRAARSTAPTIGQDRREGHQPLRRRGAEGIPALDGAELCGGANGGGLSDGQIRHRLKAGQLMDRNTWAEDGIRHASYTLRVGSRVEIEQASDAEAHESAT